MARSIRTAGFTRQNYLMSGFAYSEVMKDGTEIARDGFLKFIQVHNDIFCVHRNYCLVLSMEGHTAFTLGTVYASHPQAQMDEKGNWYELTQHYLGLFEELQGARKTAN